ncbi:MAG: hypothetical protein ACO3DT_12365, partial [Gammaproteobacteria bacterium]
QVTLDQQTTFLKIHQTGSLHFDKQEPNRLNPRVKRSNAHRVRWQMNQTDMTGEAAYDAFACKSQ